MKGIICYYSATGNTRLACEYIVRQVKDIAFDLADIAKVKDVDFTSYDVAGFAVPADFMGPPQLMQMFLEKVPQQQKKKVFVFNTYGAFGGKTLRILDEWVRAKGFTVVAGCSLQTPENYPPAILKGITSLNAPKPKDLKRFNLFISEMGQTLTGGRKPVRPKVGLLNSLIPARPRTASKDAMGKKYVDESLCTECGICEANCPYNAVRLDPKPVFDQDKCFGCWSCFNLCPNKAVYTDKICGKGHYPGPSGLFKEKLR